MDDMGDAGSAGPFPGDLLSFFQKDESRLLIIKGKPRTGKSLFALGLAEAITHPGNIFVLHTRELDAGTYSAFPWLRENEARDRAIEMARPSIAAPMPPVPPPKPVTVTPSKKPEDAAKIKSAKDLLKSILGEIPSALDTPAPKVPEPVEAPPPGSDLAGLRKVFGNREPKEMAILYRGLAHLVKKPGVVIVNRIDRYCERYSAPAPVVSQYLKNDMVTAGKAHLIFVMEKVDQSLDNVADGVVVLKEFSQGDDFMGQLELARLAGVTVKEPKFMYNLRGGRFQLLKGIKVWA